jgi:hypothetical protein
LIRFFARIVKTDLTVTHINGIRQRRTGISQQLGQIKSKIGAGEVFSRALPISASQVGRVNRTLTQTRIIRSIYLFPDVHIWFDGFRA